MLLLMVMAMLAGGLLTLAIFRRMAVVDRVILAFIGAADFLLGMWLLSDLFHTAP